MDSLKKRPGRLISVLCCLLVTVGAFAQISQPLNYCNVARDKQNRPVVGKTVGVQLTILRASATGPVVYQEKHLTPTNFFGAFLITIGTGIAQNSAFDNIKWGDDNFYLKVGLDVKGGDDFASMSAVQLLHVPFTLYAKTGGISGNSDHRVGFQHFVGEQYGGGVVFDTWKDASGIEHGYVVALNDQSDSISWSNIEAKAIGPSARSVWNGSANTAAIIAQPGQSRSAARLCANFSGGGFHDWYLPSMAEFNLLYDNRDKIKKSFGKGEIPPGLFIYWTSTELSGTNSFVFANYGFPSNNLVFSKYSPLSVRAIRAF